MSKYYRSPFRITPTDDFTGGFVINEYAGGYFQPTVQIEYLTIEYQTVTCLVAVAQLGDAAIQDNAPMPDPLLDFTAGAVTELGQQFLDTFAGFIRGRKGFFVGLGGVGALGFDRHGWKAVVFPVQAG